ncbi:MAG: YaeQ family protein [Herpetosiphon sp.]
MAPNATMYNFDIALTDMDRDVHAEFNLRAAQHPSETSDYFLTRILAYCLEYAPGISFTKGISEGDAPAIWVHDETGHLSTWVEVGMPDAQRLHTARKRVDRVAVYCHKSPTILLDQLAGHHIHRAETIPIYGIDRELLTELTSLLDRRMNWSLLVTEQQLYINIGTVSLFSTVAVHQLPDS